MTNRSPFLSASSARAVAFLYVYSSATVNTFIDAGVLLDLGQLVHGQRRQNRLLDAVPLKPLPRSPLGFLLQRVPAICGRLELSADFRFREMQVRQIQWRERADE